ncbi:reptin-like protein [Dinothrombium tinctorium]|uniref:Reptin-like protein n=1 Tax=Dinothrombium tinctorium TaxID=1965070 RepID=A0A3S3PAZ8_9ACAR|nr:reptin-like protein [Dinothrombium tinctorium]
MLEDLKDKVVLITGSSGGIGEIIAKRFSSLGSKVVITGRNSENVAKVAEECAALSPLKYEPLTVICDLNSERDIERLVHETICHFKRLDVLVNCVAYYEPLSILDDRFLENFDAHMKLNVRAVVQLCRLAIPHLSECKGPIDTPKFETFEDSESLREHYSSKTPVQRMGNRDDIANAVTYLASNASGFITGCLIPIDGGISLLG